jgi:hypothetical protein
MTFRIKSNSSNALTRSKHSKQSIKVKSGADCPSSCVSGSLFLKTGSDQSADTCQLYICVGGTWKQAAPPVS